MPRRRRFFPNTVPVHVLQRGNNRQICFTRNADMAAYMNWLKEGAAAFGLQIHAWVLMTNHVHLLVTPMQEHAISKTMQLLGRYYVRYFNYQYQRTGTLFEGRYKANLVQSDAHFLSCCRYIELNPVRAGMVTDPANYSWSSYRAHAFGKRIKVWTEHQQYEALDDTIEGRQSAYRDLLATQLDTETVNEIRHALNTGFVLGNEKFRAEVERLSGVKQSYRTRGPKPRVSEL
jgi:putative transposase